MIAVMRAIVRKLDVAWRGSPRSAGVVSLGLALALLGAGATGLRAQDWARARVEQSPRHREVVTIHHGSRALDAYVVYPQASGKRPVVLVIHEIFGLTDWAQEVADELAAAGYVALVPDLLSGEGPHGGGSASFAGQTAVARAINALPPAQIEADLNAAADWALRQPAANGKLFVVGFCWGGGQSFRFASERRDLSAAVVFYGTPPDSAAMAHITAPVYGFYAGNDERVSGTVAATRVEMKKLGKRYEAVIYPGAGHGFMRAGEAPEASSPNRHARDASWKRLARVLASHD